MTNNEIKNKKDRTAEKKIVNKTIKEDNQAKVFLKSIRISPIKLNLVVSPIRGAKVEKLYSRPLLMQKIITNSMLINYMFPKLLLEEVWWWKDLDQEHVEEVQE